jgi:spore maturation protein CgeB
VLFLGSCYSDARAQLGSVLRAVDPGCGIYGGNWQHLQADGENLYDYRPAAELYRACKIAVGDNQYAAEGFVSNRLFEAMAHGALLLHQRVPGLYQHLGLEDGVHYIEWYDFDDLRAKLAYWLDDAQREQRQRIAARGCAAVRVRHNFDARVVELFAIIERECGGTV